MPRVMYIRPCLAYVTTDSSYDHKFICVIVFCDVRLYFHFTLQAVFLLSRIVHIICAVRYRTVVGSYVDTEMVVAMIMMVITCVVFQCACW